MSGAAGRRAVVLLSGGMDSATTLAWAIRDGFEAHALTIRYGQRHALEIERAVLLARRLGAASHRLVTVDLAFEGASALTDPRIAVPRSGGGPARAGSIPVTYVPARNTVFLAIALAWAEPLGARDIFLGVNQVDFSGYPDCRPEFLEAFGAVARTATRAGVEGEAFRIHAPLLNMSKAEIVRTAAELGVELGLTLSCYDPRPDGSPCRGCDACRIRERGFREAGLEDPALAGRSEETR